MSYPPIHPARLATLREILARKGTLEEAGAAIGITRQGAWRLARKYGLAHRTCPQRGTRRRPRHTAAIRRFWLSTDSSVASA